MGMRPQRKMRKLRLQSKVVSSNLTVNDDEISQGGKILELDQVMMLASSRPKNNSFRRWLKRGERLKKGIFSGGRWTKTT